MFGIKSESGYFKTFSVETIYNYIINTEDKELKYIYEFQERTQKEFLKTFLIISGNYDHYLNLEKKLNPKLSLEEYVKKYKELQKVSRSRENGFRVFCRE